MRLMKLAAILVPVCILMMFAIAVAEENQFGIADTYRVTFTEKTHIADAVLPQGSYEVRHVMEGKDHIMVFRQIGARKPVEVRVKCTLVPLPDKAKADQKIYMLNAANERVLQELVFKGDRAKRVFF